MGKNAQTRPNHLLRGGREHLTPKEVEALAKGAARSGRHGARDALIIRFMAQHGLRVSELCAMRRSQVDLDAKRVYVRRLKNGNPSTHQTDGQHARAMRALWRLNPDSVFVFTSERGDAIDRSVVYRIIERAGKEAGLAFPVHPHMLRHACGYRLRKKKKDLRDIQDYLGHKNVQHTVIYTMLDENRFDGIED